MSADSRSRASEAHDLEPRASEAPASKAPVHATAAHADALAAASAANVTIRTLSHGEFAQAAAVMVAVWGMPTWSVSNTGMTPLIPVTSLLVCPSSSVLPMQVTD